MRRKSSAWSLARARKHGRRYPWDDWFAQSQFVLRHGNDYSCMPHGMAQMVRNVASRLGVKVRLRLSGEGRIDVTVLRNGVNS